MISVSLWRRFGTMLGDILTWNLTTALVICSAWWMVRAVHSPQRPCRPRVLVPTLCRRLRQQENEETRRKKGGNRKETGAYQPGPCLPSASLFVMRRNCKLLQRAPVPVVGGRWPVNDACIRGW
ncbi:hypothetical protein BGZ61DRAFT_441018 [Ilyonectria robusta]|uniref:uncharacterized protein n=1 Tax=Ilyonectria robusta TaxID=1079257 RepID=UPI001E8D2012|nr:uncharacterized protein BGZ61DRAFT_441018 [Ilyonectria robusta]KAH8735835.1 hypothetical protein BGZ61DRAFT_441018 [Ilyonectria robusta]